MKATVTSKGQITIPKVIRQKANIMTGTQLDFQLEEDGSIHVFLRTRDIEDIKGFVKPTGKPISLREMKKAIKKRSLRGVR